MPWTKEERSAYRKAYYQKNKVEALAQKKAYYEKNKVEALSYNKVYRQTPEGKKSNKISHWKRQGIISDDWDSLYEKFINTKNCENCNVDLTVGRYSTSTTRCLDHDHSILDRENVRNILCNVCNIKRR